jgi:hypothetical protein
VQLRTYLLREAWSLHVLSEGLVDQRLIVPPMRLPDLVPKMVHDVAVQPYRDANLFRRQRNDNSALAFAKVVLSLHVPSFI